MSVRGSRSRGSIGQILLAAFALIVSCFTFAHVAQAQWTLVAPNLSSAFTGAGSITFKDGIAWAGHQSLYRSLDSGQTWTLTGLTASDPITDIAFFDRQTGIVTTSSGAIITHDGGATWNPISDQHQRYASCCFGPTASMIILSKQQPAVLEVSNDGGSTWTPISIGSFGVMTRFLRDGTFANFSLASQSGEIALSTTLGATWTPQTSHTKYDCYNFAASPCDAEQFYVINEEGYAPTDGFAQVYSSHDRGATWTLGTPHQSPYYNGTLVCTPGAVYVGTTSSGIQRSTNNGATWTSIGGPNAPMDTRVLAAVDDNILLAMDGSGAMYRTVNSGGSPIAAPAASATFTNPFAPVLHAASCATQDTTFDVRIDACDNSPISFHSVSLEATGGFLLSHTPKLDTSLAAASIGIAFDGAGSGFDTAKLHLVYSLGGKQVDTLIRLVIARFAPLAAAPYSQPTIHAPVGGSALVHVATGITSQFAISSKRVLSVTYILSFDPTLVSIPSSQVINRITPRAGWIVGNATIANGLLTVTENNAINEQLSDSVGLGSVLFNAVNDGIATLQLVQLGIQTDTGEVVMCAGFEGGYIAHVVVGNASVYETTAAVDHLQVYPTPALPGAALTIKFATAAHRDEPVQFELFDLLGRRIWSARAIKNEFTMPAPEIAATYYLRASCKDRTPVTCNVVVR